MPNRYQTTLPLLVVLCFCLPDAAGQYAPDVRFEDEAIPSGTYEATISVSASNATVQNGSAVTFRAGQTVRLEAGFKIEAGATFRAEVDPDVGSGSGGGPIVLSDVPPHVHNSRFEYEDVFNDKIIRPGLSVRGFDAERFADGGDLGLGLKQILEKVYNERDRLTLIAFEEVLTEARNDFNFAVQLPRGEVERNTRILQARAFVTLVTYVLEQNGYTADDYQIDPTPSNPDPSLRIPSHTEALSNFKDALLSPPGGDLFADNKGDYGDEVKWGRSVTNYARTLDLYIALENAYDHYGYHA